MLLYRALLIAAVFIMSGYANEHIPTIPSYVMRLIFPVTFKKTPDLCGYYKGYRLVFDEDICIIPENKAICSYFTLVITEQIDGAVPYLARFQNKPCRLFHISRKEKNSWSIEEEKSENIPVRLPEDAIILLTNPEFIEALTQGQVSNKEERIITLPQIIIKPSVTPSTFEISSIYALLGSLDTNSMHSPIKKAVKKERALVVSMRT